MTELVKKDAARVVDVRGTPTTKPDSSVTTATHTNTKPTAEPRSEDNSDNESSISTSSDSDSPENPTVVVQTPLNGGCKFLVTADKKTYMSYVRRGIPSFSWVEMLSLLDSNPTGSELEWALQVKTNCPGVQINNIKTKQVTHPKKPVRLSVPARSSSPSPTDPSSD
jgi:hypothetical protein